MGNKTIIKVYEKYLSKYLGIQLEIKARNYTIADYIVKFSRGKHEIKLSSGEYEFFNLITRMILSGSKNSFIFIDEPELHLHFQWQAAMQQLIKQLVKDLNIQFFIVSHSPKFITEDIRKNIFKVYKKKNRSKIVKPNRSLLNEQSKKDIFALHL